MRKLTKLIINDRKPSCFYFIELWSCTHTEKLVWGIYFPSFTHSTIEKLKNIQYELYDNRFFSLFILFFLSYSSSFFFFSSSSFSFSFLFFFRPMDENVQHPSGQFPTQTESLVYCYSTEYTRIFSHDEKSTLTWTESSTYDQQLKNIYT